MQTLPKVNSHLQELKQKYESIKDFDEKPFEMRIRQMRLNRLFGEIEHIREKDSKRGRLKEKSKAIVNNNQRAKNLQKAKELGQQFSRFNAKTLGDKSIAVGSKYSVHLTPQCQEKKECLKSSVDKGIVYGNKVSKINMQKMLKTKSCKGVLGALKQSSSQTIKNSEATESIETLDSSNSLSNFSTSTLVRDNNQTFKHNNCNIKSKILNTKTCDASISDNVNILKNEMFEAQDKNEQNDETKALLTKSLNHNLNIYEHPVDSLNRTEKTLILNQDTITLKENNTKLSLDTNNARHVSNCSDNQFSNQVKQTCEVFKEDDGTFQLRSISSNTNLQLADFSTNESDEISSLEDLEISETESVVCVENLLEDVPSSNAHDFCQTLAQTTSMSHKNGTEGEPLGVLSKDQQVANLVKSYEPYSMEVVKKEIELGVIQLRQIFEHKNA